MLTPAYVNLNTFFYPLGNTPAVSLTQGLPLGKQANILLLGCGDVRHILFTVHTDRSQRSLDITCCDVEKGVIARNILLLSLIIDDVGGSRDEYHWNLFYHFRIDTNSFKLLQSQAQKLYLKSASLKLWHESTYGRRIRICDSHSLEKIRSLWKFYGTERNDDENCSLATQLEVSLKKSEQFKAMLGPGINVTGFRSATPTHLQALDDLDSLHQHYWKHGSTFTEQEALSMATQPNPMFLSPDDNLILHYGTDPLLGFHLAAAYMPLDPDRASRTKVRQVDKPTPEDVVNVAKAEFRTWSSSFRKHGPNTVTLRFVTSDALALSYSLQHQHNTAVSPRWYCDRFHFDPLVLDGEDYGVYGVGPLLFDIIDTSNLIDHVGALNLLTATSPLLADSTSSILYVERLVRSEQTVNGLLNEILCGDPPTISLLLGLVPVDFVTNTSATSTGDEMILDAAIRHASDKTIGQGQCFARIAWKRPLSCRDVSNTTRPAIPVGIDPAGLAHLLYQVYLKMFEIEDTAQMMSNLTLTRLQKLSLPKYQRASFAAFLSFVKTRTLVDWETTMNILLDSVENNSTHMMGRHYIQELYVWLHLLGLYTVALLKEPLNRNPRRNQQADLRSWKDAPPFLCITLEVPRPKLGVFTKMDLLKLGTPPLHGLVQAPITSRRQWQNLFAALQTGFGTITSTGAPYTSSFELNIIEDRAGWAGTSPLLVSFYAPTWTLLLEPRTAIVAVGVQSTPQTASTFMSNLGVQMNVFQTTLADGKQVYFSKNLPNHVAGHPAYCHTSNSVSRQDVGEAATNIAITALVDIVSSKVSSLAGRVSLLSRDHQAKLRNGRPVRWTASTPFKFIIQLDEGVSFDVEFPAPVLIGNVKTRIARKSSYIELIAQLAGESDWPTLPFVYLIMPEKGVPECWNIPYLDIEALPALATEQGPRLGWLSTHVSMMFSKREQSLRENPSQDAPNIERTKVELKDSLFSMFTICSGLQGHQARIFGISCPAAGGVHILLFVSCLRLEILNRTILLDAAALPLHNTLMSRLRPFLQALTDSGSLCQIRTSKEEMELWKLMLPAWVERCRSWPHRVDCAYRSTGQIPLSVEKGERSLCACGEGRLPVDFIRNVPRWHEAQSYAVRVAISPMFPAFPLDTMGYSDLKNNNLGKSTNNDQVVCMKCGRDRARDGSELLRCGRCRRTKYCSKECQQACWKTHKNVCRNSG